ncbi:peptide/nickel transport system ATP-binding protein [Ochrobactrum sp. 19YEA23]|uniref:ABC transporter ATP-binding protein n=1 Tax=Ochrobactrum sp. 19YEA23 TaxID=3039854 RepID=UPI00247AD1BD|nr:peptide/nickel transport system ATP-binding protein [Ochrobactrum sp. 19YEA23]
MNQLRVGIDQRPNSAETLIDVSRLKVSFDGVHEPVVKDISFSIAKGECLAIVGESGSGKSVTARSLIGLAGRKAIVSGDRLAYKGANLLANSDRSWRRIRGAEIGFVLQDALVSLDPLRTVGREVAEAARVHNPDLKGKALEAFVIDLLSRVGVPEPARRARQLPSELSGGLRQRALIATALAGNPDLLIADEPTTALDVTVQAQILSLFETLKQAGKGLLVISHDLAVVSRLADRIAVMNNGRIVEIGTVDQVLCDPQDDYTKLLIAAVPTGKPRGTRLSTKSAPPAVVTHASSAQVVARVESVSKRFLGANAAGRNAVESVSFELREGETLGVVGESGSGKTTTSRILLGLTQPDSGLVEIGGKNWSSLRGRERLELRRGIQVIYQDTLSSFDPRYSVGPTLDEAISVAGITRAEVRKKRALELLDAVGLNASFLDRFPIEMSGGQRQRVAIARALAPEPKVIVCDEPVSALDVSVQAQVLDLLADLQAQTRVAYLFISHDLGVINHISDRVIVMKDGRIVEEGETFHTMTQPSHPYTMELIAAIPRIKGSSQAGIHV